MRRPAFADTQYSLPMAARSSDSRRSKRRRRADLNDVENVENVENVERTWSGLSFSEERRRRELLQRLNEIANQKKTLSTLKNIKDDAPEKQAPETWDDNESLLAEDVEKKPLQIDTASLPSKRFNGTDLNHIASPLSARGESNVFPPDAKADLKVPMERTESQRAKSRSRRASQRSSKPVKGAPRNRQSVYCLRLVKDFLRLKDSYGFAKPIDEIWTRDQLPGYFELIEHPIDLRTIRNKLNDGSYFTKATEPIAIPEGTENGGDTKGLVFDSQKFAADMRLVFANAKKYNQPGDVYYQAAGRLLEKFEKKFEKLPSLTAPPKKPSSRPPKKKRKKSHPPAHEAPPAEEERLPANKRVPEVKKSTPAHRVEQSGYSRPELEDRIHLIKKGLAIGEKGRMEKLYNTPMTYEEKVKLSQDVNLLGPEKLQKLIALVSKAMSSEMEVNEEEEVELDIEKLDNKTLRDMESMVNEHLYKKGGKVQGMSREKATSELKRLQAILQDMKRAAGESTSDSEESGEEDSGSDSRSDSGSSDYDSSDSDEDEAGEGKVPASADEVRRRRERNLAHMRQMAGVITPAASPGVNTAGKLYSDNLSPPGNTGEHTISPGIQSSSPGIQASSPAVQVSSPGAQAGSPGAQPNSSPEVAASSPGVLASSPSEQAGQEEAKANSP